MSNVFRVITGAKTMGEFAQRIDDTIQYTQLVENGTLCYKCGEMVESAVITDSNVLFPAGKPCLCNACKKNSVMTTNYDAELTTDKDITPVDENQSSIMETNYDGDLNINKDFIPVENESEEN